jgi:hypothetical protein
MRCARLWLVGLGVLAAAAASPPVRAGDPAAKPMTAEKLADTIDQMIEAKWRDKEVKPAPLADDTEFLRRLSLDVGGRIPAVQDVRLFLGDKSPEKRHKAVDKLLDSPLYSTHFAAVWRALMVPDNNNAFLQGNGPQLERWLKKRLRENARYDDMVREIITTPVTFNGGMRPGGRAPTNEPSPLPFYTANEMKPENLAAATSRLFLGVKIECAQCHNHPFAKWKREQFWEYAAFFAGLQRDGQNFFGTFRELNDRREIAIPNTTQVVQAGFLDGTEPRWKYKVGPRVTLADWVTSAENPYFAKAAANRLWAHFFGVGIVDPVDDLADEKAEPSHPELLDELARQFASHKFDLKFLIRAITLSKTYQLTSAQTDTSQEDMRLFARVPVKGMTADQLFDSVSVATGYREPRGMDNPFIFNGNSPRNEFVTKFASQDKRTESQTSILQALALMNGKLVADATSVERSVALAAVADAPFLDTAGKVEALFLGTLSRKPTSAETERFVKYVEGGGPQKDKKKALADVFWALLNSSEFILNH